LTEYGQGLSHLCIQVILMPNLTPDFSIRVLDGVDVDVSIASLQFPNEIADRPSSQRTDQIAISQHASHDTPSNRYAEFGRAE
jgi:hypothetical protein